MRQYRHPSQRSGRYKYKLDYCVICYLGKDKTIKENKDIDYRHLDLHHIDEVANAKKEGRKINNSRFNLITICTYCHRRIHIGEMIINRYVESTGGICLMWKLKEEDNWRTTKV